jgi:uncharacterized membrane protein YqaE (UPF0057 family)
MLIKVTFLNIEKLICIKLNKNDPFQLQLEQIKGEIRRQFNIDKSKSFFLLNKQHLITNQTIDHLISNATKTTNAGHELQPLECKVVISLRGGGFIIDDILTALFSIIKMFIKMGPLFEGFINLFINSLEMIALLFDPPAFINDVMFGVSWGINKIFSRAMDSITESAKSPEKDDTDTSPFGENGDQGRMTCADPTLGMILLLVVCPPLAIFYKMGIAGMVSAIICGVLCVKLYYFPGLLFAILHVLC